MGYSTIELNPQVPESIRSLVSKRIEPYLRDVRLMLEFPRYPGEPGFNFCAASALFSVIGGLSRVFFRSIKEDRLSFLAVAKRFPLADEPDEAIRESDRFATELYETYRCNLIHSLGLPLDWSKANSRWEIAPLPSKYKVVALEPPSAEMLDDLDAPAGRPGWLPSTLSDDGKVVRLSREALYWGMRRLVRVLAEDSQLHRDADEMITEWSASPTPSSEVTSSATQYVGAPRNAGIDATLSAGSISSSSLNKGKPD